jgi:hypothetical protein
MKQRITYISIALFVLLFLTPQVHLSAESHCSRRHNWESIWENQFKNNYGGFQGSGTLSDPYQISQSYHLAKLAYEVNVRHNTYKGKYFKLTADINLQDYKIDNMNTLWVPIGIDHRYPFEGYFDGNGKTISGLMMWPEGSKESQFSYGLFGASRGFIRNLNIKGGEIDFRMAGEEVKTLYVGMLCGYLFFDRNSKQYGAVYGCTVDGNVSGGVEETISKKASLGGIVGYADNPVSIYRCHSGVNIDVTYISHVGGIIGTLYGYNVDQINHWKSNWGPLESFVFDCTYKGTLKGKRTGDVGGICGWNDGGNIEACATAGDFSVYFSDFIGGICGTNKGNIIGCVSVAHLTNGMYAGGIAASNSSTTIGGKTYMGLINYCSYSGHIDNNDQTSFAGISTSTKTVLTNCLFTGSAQPFPSSPYQPVSFPDNWQKYEKNQNCYYDSNIFNDEQRRFSETRIGLPTGTLTNGQEGSCPFVTANVSSLKNTYFSEGAIEVTGVSFKYQEGFYPRLVITSGNNAETGTMTDNVIEEAKRVWGDQTNLKAPALFPAYAFMAAVPMPFGNNHRAYELEMNFPLAEKSSDGFKATYHLPDNQKLIKIENNQAVLQDPGTMLVTIKSDKGLEKQVFLNISIGKQWDGTFADSYDGGNGSEASPYLLHNARQFAKMMRDNQSDEFYKLTQDILFNTDLIQKDGSIKADAKVIDQNSAAKNKAWKAHLDGAGHMVKGLCMIDQWGIFTEITSGASIENVGFVDTYVQNVVGLDLPDYATGFLAMRMFGNAVVRNCIFQGLASDSPRSYTINNSYDTHGLVTGIYYKDGVMPTIEDCVIAIYGKYNKIKSNIFRYARKDGDKWTDYDGPVTTVNRILVLGGAAEDYVMDDKNGDVASCYFPKGYFDHPTKPGFNNYERTIEELTSGTIFANERLWQSEKGYFPMLKSFAGNDWGRLLSLPFLTDGDNRLDGMKRQMELRYGATLQTNNQEMIEIDDDMMAIAPLQKGKCMLQRTLGKAHITTPIIIADDFKPGVSFDDEHARALCETNFDSDGNQRLSLSELRKVDENKLASAINNSQQEAEQIVRFNEFALFRGITKLGITEEGPNASQRRAAAAGTAFHNMKNLKEFRIPESVTTIGDEAFKGCDKLETVTLTHKVTSISGKAFYNSNVKNILVDQANTTFTSNDGLLYNKEDELVCYPNGRKTSSLTLPGVTRRILKHAIYKVPGLDSIFIEGRNQSDMIYLANDGIVHHSQDAGASAPAMRIYVNDGSFDQRLFKQYKNDDKWGDYEDCKHLGRYYPLTFNDAKAATLYLGFDTQLPADLRVYLVSKEDSDEQTATLLNISKKIENKLAKNTAVVVRSSYEGVVKLYPYTGDDVATIPLYLNALNGVGEQGLRVNQGDSNQGNCLTLGRNSQKQLGFFYYKNNFIQPYHAYLTANTITARMVRFNDVNITDSNDEPLQELDADLFDDLFAYKKSDDGKSCRAVWYYGDDQNINIPAEVEGIPVTALGKNLFYDNDVTIWSVNVPSSIKTLRVARQEKDNPFYGLNDSTIVYLPSADAGYTVADDEWNVVMGDQCKRLYLVDSHSFIPPRDFYADYVQYTNQFWAKPDIIWNYEAGDIEEMKTNPKDGTGEALAPKANFDLFDIQYSRKAYAVCLPFDVDLKAMATNDESDLKAYQLKYVKDNSHFIFVEVAQQLKAGEPYFLVVNGGGYILLNDTKTKISAQLHPLTVTDFNTGAVVGEFRGVLSFLTNDEAVNNHAYVIQSTGNWHRIANQTEKQKKLQVWPFRAYFSRTDGFVRNRYFTNYQAGSSNVRQRAALEDDGITDFPADAYYSDIDFEVEDDATAIRPTIHTIDLDGTERIYDLNGRPLNSKPNKGVYIKNGKKFINK